MYTTGGLESDDGELLDEFYFPHDNRHRSNTEIILLGGSEMVQVTVAADKLESRSLFSFVKNTLLEAKDKGGTTMTTTTTTAATKMRFFFKETYSHLLQKSEFLHTSILDDSLEMMRLAYGAFLDLWLGYTLCWPLEADAARFESDRLRRLGRRGEDYTPPNCWWMRLKKKKKSKNIGPKNHEHNIAEKKRK